MLLAAMLFSNKKPRLKRRGCIIRAHVQLNGCAFFDGLSGVSLLAAQPVNNRDKGEYDANPVKAIRHGVDYVLESPLEAVGYRLKDALKVHG
jgi:hypothetical protein